MAKRGGYLGGHSIEGPGAAYYWPTKEDGEAPRHIDPEITREMNAQDEQRRQGIDTTAATHRKNGKRLRKNRKKERKAFAIGARVEHEKFGRGVILSRIGETLEVFFECEETRQIRQGFLKPAAKKSSSPRT